MTLLDQDICTAHLKGRSYKLAAGNGLFVLVNPNGSKLWRFKYRFEGKEKQLALGAYPEMSIVDANLLCGDARQLLAQGIDPSVVRKKEKARARSERLAVEGLPSVRVLMDGGVEIWKGKDVLRLNLDERRFVKDLLNKLE